MSDTLEVKKENVQKAAETCDTAKEVLEELFPEAFDYEGLVKLDSFYVDKSPLGTIYIGQGHAPDNLVNRCLVLSNSYDWELSTYKGKQILIPRKK